MIVETHEPSCVRYPRRSLGRTFERLGVPAARLAHLLGVGRLTLAGLALCPAPDPEGDEDVFAGRIRALAVTFGVDPERLAFVCRAAG